MSRLLRRLAALALLTLAGLGAMAVAAAPPAAAHPLGNFTVNRYSGIDLAPGSVRITYVVDMAEIPTYQETPNIDTDGDGTITGAERQAWADRTAPKLLSSLHLAVDGSALRLQVDTATMTFRPGQAGLPILRLVLGLRGSIAGRTGRVDYRDANYQGRIGWKEITARAEPGRALIGSSVPTTSVSDALLGYPVNMLTSPLDVTSATFSFRPGTGTAGSSAPDGAKTVSGAPIASGGSFAGLVSWRLTPLIFVGSLALAFGFGAVHALGPGHGKTITAAYLVGSGARRAQATAIGVAVSLMHTASVLALGLVFLVLARSFPPERVYPWLEIATGLVALGLGAYLLTVRVRARRGGDDPWHGHTHAASQDHEHPHDHDHDPARPVTPRSLAALAVAGGILPSPTAFVVLLGAVRAHRIAYGLGLILAFSVGLATALVLVGVFAIRARSSVAERLHGRWGSLIPVASAAVIVGFGVFFVTRGTTRIL